jgi:hypothetical protein
MLASYGRRLPGFELWGALLMDPQLGLSRAGAGDRQGGLCAALAGVHREPFVLPEPW